MNSSPEPTNPQLCVEPLKSDGTFEKIEDAKIVGFTQKRTNVVQLEDWKILKNVFLQLKKNAEEIFVAFSVTGVLLKELDAAFFKSLTRAQRRRATQRMIRDAKWNAYMKTF